MKLLPDAHRQEAALFCEVCQSFCLCFFFPQYPIPFSTLLNCASFTGNQVHCTEGIRLVFTLVWNVTTLCLFCLFGFLSTRCSKAVKDQPAFVLLRETTCSVSVLGVLAVTAVSQQFQHLPPLPPIRRPLSYLLSLSKLLLPS